MKRLIRVICLMVMAIGLSSCAILYPADVYERDVRIYHHTYGEIYYRQPHYYYYNHTPPPPNHHHKPGHPPHHKEHNYERPSKPSPNPQRPSTPPHRPNNGSSRPTTHR